MVFPHIVEFYPSTETVSTSTLGGISRTFSNTGQRVAAFVQFKSDSYAIINDTQGNNILASIYVDGVFPAKPYDRIKYKSVWYEVTGTVPGLGVRGVHYTKLNTSQNNQI
jgi:cytolysin (calcineurin-like family phosphatase)